MTDKTGNIVAEGELVNKEHDVILERLNQTLHYQDHGDIFYAEQPFMDSINKWDGIPIIFASEHPNFKTFDSDPTKELANIKGSIVGRISAPKLERTGTSRVEAKFVIDNPIIENMINEGKLAHSPGFRFQADSNNHLTSVIPHHVLVFIQDAKNQPRDKGAMILNKIGDTEMANKEPTTDELNSMLDYMANNPGKMDKATMDKLYAAMDKANQKEYTKSMLKDLQSHPEMMDDEMKSMMKDMNMTNKQEINMGKEDELSKQLEISNKEKETLTGEIAGLKNEIANKDAQLKVFEQKEATRLKAQEDANWLTIKNKLKLNGQAGLVHKAEDEASLREGWVANKDDFYLKHFVLKEQKVLPGDEGKEMVNIVDDDKPSEGAKLGDYDPKTGGWK